MKRHFVTFLSPGTFVAETTVREIDSWDITAAAEMAHTVLERYNATPYAFQFSTRERKDDELDSKVVDKSPYYFLGGKVETLAEIEARNDPNENILRSNMRNNNYAKVLTNTNSWKITVPLNPNDVVLDWTPCK